MAANKRSRIQIEHDRREIAQRYLRGELQVDIGKALGLSQQMVSYDLGRIRQAWLASSLRDFDAAKAEQLAKIDHLERTYWEAWERSLEEATTTTQYARADERGSPAPAKAVIRTDPGLGDPRWLAGIQWCIERRCKILGLDAPERRDFTSGGMSLVEIEEWKLKAAKQLQDIQQMEEPKVATSND